MDLLGTPVPQFLHREIPQLGSPDYRILANQYSVVLDYLLDRNKLHLGHKVPGCLDRWRIAPAIARCVFYQRPPIRLSRLNRVSDCMGDPRIRDAGDKVDFLCRFFQKMHADATFMASLEFVLEFFTEIKHITITIYFC